MVRDPRRERGRLLAEDDRIKHVDGPLWFVPSSTTGGYVVDMAASTCPCPDHKQHRAKCKHLWAVEFRRAMEPTPAPPVVPRPMKPMRLNLRGDLTAEEQANVRAALRFLRTRAGGSAALGKALRLNGGTLDHVAGRQPVSASLTVRLARFAGVPVDDLLTGRWPLPGMCAHCGRGP